VRWRRAKFSVVITTWHKRFSFIQSQYAPKLAEKSFKKLIKESERDTMVFFDLNGTQREADLDSQFSQRKAK
jgi:hypothetical protein